VQLAFVSGKNHPNLAIFSLNVQCRGAIINHVQVVLKLDAKSKSEKGLDNATSVIWKSFSQGEKLVFRRVPLVFHSSKSD